MSDVIGWNWMFKLSEDDLKKKEDVLTLMVHFLLIKAGYKCIGLGDDKNISDSETECETLPANWSASSNYSIRYVLNDSLYILRGVPVDNNIVFNFLRVDTLAVTNVAFNINDTVDDIKGPLEKLFKNKAADVVQKVRMELLNSGPGKDSSTQTPAGSSSNSTSTEQRPSASNPHLGPIPVMVPIPQPRPEPIWVEPPPERDPGRIGRSDLDPFARGGGMVFDPFGPGNWMREPGMGPPGGLPRGAIPPGARFDPFGPPGGPAQPRRPPQPPPDSDDILPPWYS